MDVNLIDQAQLSASSPEEVATYLQVRGWNVVFRDAGGTAWAPGADDAEDAPELWVPRSDSMRGYRNRIAHLVDTLSDIEGRSAAQILFEITHTLQDVQRIRTLPRSESGTVNLADGTGTLAGIYKWVASAAASTAATQSGPLLSTRRPLTAENFMEQVKLAVPEPGSFVWKVAVPLANRDGEQTIPFAESESRPELSGFNRRVTRTLYNASSAVLRACKTVDEGESVLPAFDAVVSEGVTANFCEGLAETGGDRHVPYEIGFAWASTVPAPETETLRFGGLQLEVIKQAAAEFRRVAPEPDVQVRGYIVRLSRESEQRPGVVTVAGTLVGDSQEKFGHFGFELVSEDYAAALHSHEDHQIVVVQGDMVRRGNRKWLENVHGFRVLNEEPG